MNASLPVSAYAAPSGQPSNPFAGASVHSESRAASRPVPSVQRLNAPRRSTTSVTRFRQLAFTVAMAAGMALGAAAFILWPWTNVLLAASTPPAAMHETQAVFLTRSTLMALNDANRSANYSVLRDLAGPRFQQRNTIDRLAEIFRPFRQANIDLSHAGMVTPRISRAILGEGDLVLSIAGHIPVDDSGAAHAIRFDLAFEAIGDHWRLLTLSVDVVPATH